MKMENVMKVVCVVALATIMGSAWAECPRDLNVNQMYDCIVSENAGDEDGTPKEISNRQGSSQQRLKAYIPTEKQAQTKDTKHADM